MKDISPERWQRLEGLLDQALERPPDERAAFLDAACADDPALRQQLAAMLEAGAASLLDEPTGEGLAGLLQAVHAEGQEAAPETQRVGQHVGPYRLLRPIGRGGMGQVFLAVRDDEAFKQYVAVKVIRRGLDTEDILHRFRTERQILASLNHPNIARLLDGGATDDGLSYFVMEYIEGVPIHTYCDTHRLSIEDRLRLFQGVCAAVHYAHQNLIVHRDLKPSNILVTPDGVPKLLDFGIAKFLNPNLPGYTVPMTRTELRVMTPEYASPEQIRGETLTTASDVYALGVLLYELLTGQRPFHLIGRAQLELERVICETDPEPPSTAIRRADRHDGKTGTGTRSETPGRVRDMPPERLQRRLKGDLDTIVLMALRKEPERRYQSADHLLEDIKRHLAGLPVSAQRATVGYRARKFIQRHKLGVTAAAALVLLLIATASLAVGFAVVTSRQAKQIALEAAKAEQVKDFMIRLFEVSDPENARGAEVKALELLDRGAEQVEIELADQPEVQAEMLGVMGVVYRQLGMYDKARPLLERSLAMRRGLFGQQHEDVAQSLYDLGWLLGEVGDYEASERLTRESLEMRLKLLGPKHPDVARSLNDLGGVMIARGAFDEAVPLFRQAVAMHREVSGDESRDLAESMVNLAWVLHEKGDYDEAEQLYRDALAMQRKLLGKDHPLITTTLNNLGALMYDKGAYREAEPFFREVLALRRRLLGPDHPLVGNSVNWMGRVMQRKGDYAAAESLYREAHAIHRNALGAEHPVVGRDLDFLGQVLHATGKDAEAEQTLREALAIFSTALPEAHPYTAQARLELGQVLLDQRRPQEAEDLFRHVLAFDRDTYGEEDERTVEAGLWLGAALAAQARYDEAEGLLLEGYAFFKDGQPQQKQARQALADLYTAWGRPDRAAAYRNVAAGGN